MSRVCQDRRFRRNEMEAELAQFVDDRMAGVVAGGIAGNYLGFLGQ